MKNLFITLFTLLLSLGIYAETEESSSEAMTEDEYENGCDNELDDDLDGDTDSDDSDCEDKALLLADYEDSDLQSVLVWGIGIAILNSVGGDSGTGTATTE